MVRGLAPPGYYLHIRPVGLPDIAKQGAQSQDAVPRVRYHSPWWSLDNLLITGNDDRRMAVSDFKLYIEAYGKSATGESRSSQ